MVDKYIIRSYHNGDEEEIVQLLKLIFNGWPKFDLKCSSIDHWRWKFKENPFKKFAICLAILNDEIIGCEHTVLRKLKIGDRLLLSGNGVDVGVHPKFRGMGVYKSMDEPINELRKKIGIKLAVIVSGNPRVIKSLDKIYPHFPHAVLEFVRVKDIDLHLRMMQSEQPWLKKYGFHLVSFINKLKNTFTNYDTSENTFRISEINAFDDRVNAFSEEINEHYNFIIERSKEYLNWRYCDYRAGEYVVKQAVEHGRILGYSVLRTNRYRNDYPIGYIVDLLALPDRTDVANALVADAVEYFNSKKINIVKCLLIRGHLYDKILQKHNFVNSMNRLNIFLKIYENVEETLIKIKKSPINKLHFAYGDYDSI